MTRLFALMLLCLSVGPAHAIDCERFLRLHGFASRAQFQCGFARYSPDVMEQARSCNAHLSEARVKQLLTGGTRLFDQRDAEMGRASLCADILRKMPGVLGR